MNISPVVFISHHDRPAEFDEDIGERWWPDLEPMQFAIYELADSRRFVVAAVNNNGGRCGCCGDFNDVSVRRVEIFQFIAQGIGP